MSDIPKLGISYAVIKKELHLGIFGIGEDLTEEQALKVIRRAEEYNPWIPVTERLPKDRVYVHIVGMPSEYVGIGCYNEKEKIWKKYGVKIRWTVTHWKPIILPEQALGDQP